MKIFFFRTIIILFFAYWLITLFFILPKNPLSLSIQTGKDYFQANFFQRWAFFAPPPNYNQRVYFVYKNKYNNTKEIFEILKPILDQKSKTAPFNSYYQTMDYILASSLINIDGNIRILQQVINYQSSKDSNASHLSDSLATQKVVNDIEKTTDFLTLSRYAKKIALENKFSLNDILYQIQISKIFMPQFVDRFTVKSREEISFSSHFLNF